MNRRHHIDAGPWLPGWLLRALLIVVAISASLLLDAPIGWTVAAAGLAVLGALVPRTGAVWMVAGALILLMLFLPPAHARAAVVVAAVPLLHSLGALSFVVGARTRVVVRALVPMIGRYLAIQILAQVALAAVLLIPTGGSLPWAAIAGACAVAGLALAAVVQQRRSAAHRADVGGPS